MLADEAANRPETLMGFSFRVLQRSILIRLVFVATCLAGPSNAGTIVDSAEDLFFRREMMAVCTLFIFPAHLSSDTVINRQLDEERRFEDRYSTSYRAVLMDTYGLSDEAELDNRADELSHKLRRDLSQSSQEVQSDCQSLALSFGLSFEEHTFSVNTKEEAALVAALQSIFEKKMAVGWCKNILTDDQLATSKERDEMWYQFSLRKTGAPLFDYVQAALGPVKFRELLEPLTKPFSEHALSTHNSFSDALDKKKWCLDFFER